ncbi:NAD-dependent epimerase/dehydratase family protein [Streptomyces sp. ISL-11]|uniref:NAD-dependent epimerase/dehydratase family protein n=1 Tax=Streptomyces sp. ISL-11 TaxID=2819174 RepID=UPI001BEA4912|nr:NAD-dependent epimerase/dehydratase family protein [Streptomyces sp. ISL-11]MBT2384316.1 NAD-dependent epimerase/dehydratase family protein [Streptomyces sp. ISL-11]
MRVLVTGGSGFLGHALCQQLTAAGHEVRSLHRRFSRPLATLGTDQRLGDIRDSGTVRHAAAGCDAVLHTAARVGLAGDPASFFATNVTGTRHVVDACLHHRIGTLIYTSSPSVVFDNTDIDGGDEALPYARRPLGPYPGSKATAERLVLAANGPNLATAALRPHCIWGPGDPHFAPRLLRAARFGVLPLPGGGRKRVDTVYVDNAAHAHLLALDRVRPGTPAAGRPYFISQGRPCTFARTLTAFFRALGRSPRLQSVPDSLARTAGMLCEGGWRLLRLPGEPPLDRCTVAGAVYANWFDISAARTRLGYTPLVSTREGLRRLRQTS